MLKKIRNASLLTIAMVGMTLPMYSLGKDYFEISKNLDIFVSMVKELNTYYVDQIDASKLIKDAIDGMLDKLDPYTNYITEAEMEGYKLQTTGKYGGIGATIRQNKEWIEINEPYEGFPASKAGLISGDIILEIEGKSMKDKKSDDVSDLLRGAPGTTVKLKIKRPGNNETYEKTITREEIKLKSVPFYGMVDDHIGYVRLNSFTDNCSREVSNAIKDLQANHDLQGLIFDLRGNPGGLLNEAVNVSNLFIDKNKLVVSTKGKVAEWDKEYNTSNDPVEKELPLVILTSRGSASASEIVSGVVQDYDRGVIVGQNSYGKGLVQTTRNLPYNTKLKLTTAKYYVPSGRCIQAIDYTHRNEDGSVGKIADSLKTAFKTQNGRTVYDGGGVAPDVAVEAKEYSNVTISLLRKQLFFEYASIYKSSHSSIAKAADFTLTDAEYNDFVAWLKDKDYEYKTKTEEMLKSLEDQAKKDELDKSTLTEIEALHGKINHDKNNDLTQHKAEVKEMLESEIVSRYYFQAGKIDYNNHHDTDVKEALKVLQDKAKYNSILKK